LAKNILFREKVPFLKTKISIRRHSPLKTVFENTFDVLAHAFSVMHSYNFLKPVMGQDMLCEEMHFWQSCPHGNVSHIYRD